MDIYFSLQLMNANLAQRLGLWLQLNRYSAKTRNNGDEQIGFTEGGATVVESIGASSAPYLKVLSRARFADSYSRLRPSIAN